MQNADIQRIIASVTDSLLFICYLFGSGNWAANILVTEHLQYPVHFCFPLSQQKTELLLIFNQLRFSFSSLHLLASCILFHLYRHCHVESQIPIHRISRSCPPRPR